MKKALFLGVVASLAQTGHCGGEDDQVVMTSLSTVRSSPDAFQNVTVRFTVQFNQLGKVSNPFFTRFVPTDYVNFYSWPAEQPIWRKEAYDDLFGLLFLSKESKQLAQIYDLKSYDRVEITGVVRSIFQGAPWIEVMSFATMPTKVTTATLAHLYRGEELMKKRQWQLAINELSVATANGTPVEVQSAVHKNLGICYLRMGEPGTAFSHLNSATTLMPGGDQEAERLASAAKSKPERELDRSVTPSGIKDSERPLWEAFDDVRPRTQPPQAQPVMPVMPVVPAEPTKR